MVRTRETPRQAPVAVRCLMLALSIAVAGAARSDTLSGMELDCQAAGYDIRFTNTSSSVLEPGQMVAWEVRFVRKSGLFEIEEPLDPGEGVFVSGALGSDYLSAPQPCTAIVQ